MGGRKEGGEERDSQDTKKPVFLQRSKTKEESNVLKFEGTSLKVS